MDTKTKEVDLSFSDDMRGSEGDVRRPAITVHKVHSFTIGDRLRNMIRQKYAVSDGEEAASSSASGCRRCSRV